MWVNFPRMVLLYLVSSETTVYVERLPMISKQWTPFYWACCHPRNNGWLVTGAWVGLIMYFTCRYIKKEQKQVSIKRFLKRNLANVGMAQWTYWLTKYTNKECHTVFCTGVRNTVWQSLFVYCYGPCYVVYVQAMLCCLCTGHVMLFVYEPCYG